MAARARDSGTVAFGLVSIPIKLYTATSPQNVTFNRLHATCGTPLRDGAYCHSCKVRVGSGRWLADEGEGMVRGYEVSKDRYVSFTTDELRKLEAEKTDRFDIESTDRALECSERV